MLVFKFQPSCASLNDKILKKYAVGSYFGELSLLLADHPRSCDLVCLSHVETRELDRNSFENIINDYPEMKKIMIGKFLEYTLSCSECLKLTAWYI